MRLQWGLRQQLSCLCNHCVCPCLATEEAFALVLLETDNRETITPMSVRKHMREYRALHKDVALENTNSDRADRMRSTTTYHWCTPQYSPAPVLQMLSVATGRPTRVPRMRNTIGSQCPSGHDLPQRVQTHSMVGDNTKMIYDSPCDAMELQEPDTIVLRAVQVTDDRLQCKSSDRPRCKRGKLRLAD